ncbi:MAG: hypothetical protein JWQ72_808 [Polaromonas sp.]|nr:hypothetical protein [Polaromonas sp.]
MTTTADIARSLDLERQRQGLTATDLIERAGVSRAALYRLIKGGDVQLTTLLAITNALGLDLVAMRGNLARLMPEVGTQAPATASEPAPPPRMSAAARSPAVPSTGPLSAVAARAARLEHRLKGARP